MMRMMINSPGDSIPEGQWALPWGTRRDGPKMHRWLLVLPRWLPRRYHLLAQCLSSMGLRGVGRGSAQTKGHLVLILLARFGFLFPPRQTPNT